MKYGPETPTVEAFLRHLKGMTPEQWAAASDAASDAAAWDAASDAASDAAAWDAASDAAWYAASDAARDAAWYAAMDAACYAVYEIVGASLMRERGQPFYFLPMFGFKNPEAVLEQA